MFTSNDTILVTGGSGFIGSTLIRTIINHTSCSVVNIDLRPLSKDITAEFSNDKRYGYISGNIAASGFLTSAVQFVKPDYVLHLAAETHVDHSIDNPEIFLDTNIVGSYRLLEALRSYFYSLTDVQQNNFRFVHVSTDEVFGALSADDVPFVEKAPYNPRSPYSASKASSNHLVMAWHHTYRLPTLLTYGSNTFGPRQVPTALIPVSISRALNNKPVEIYGSGQQQRDWIYVEDHAAAILHVLQKGKVGNSYNVSASNQVRNIDLIGDIMQCMDQICARSDGASYRQMIKHVADRPGHDFRYALDSSQLQQLGWSPQMSFREGILKTVKWYINNQDWCGAHSPDYMHRRGVLQSRGPL